MKTEASSAPSSSIEELVEVVSSMPPMPRMPIDGDGCWMTIPWLAKTGCNMLAKKHDSCRARPVHSRFPKPIRVVACNVSLCRGRRVGSRFHRCQRRSKREAIKRMRTIVTSFGPAFALCSQNFIDLSRKAKRYSPRSQRGGIAVEPNLAGKSRHFIQMQGSVSKAPSMSR